MQAEIERRKGNTEKVLELLRAHPRTWIRAEEFMDLAGSLAWRTRLSDARKVIEAEGGKLENRQWRVNRTEGYPPARMVLGPIVSEYRWLPQAPLGRSADVPTVQPSFF